ncbi:peroxidase 20-like [Magnolia sinica]|uniref:peroxidase 20-like n=1 Tax=Magnolia sinica TaxID=86752 RepID=UPI00265859E9|nr:peroxidase 20-like [Magnolia sinica]
MGLIRILLMAIFPIAISLLVFHGIEAFDDGLVLFPDYYKNSCPQAERIVRQQVRIAIRKDPRMAASLLRLHFHDCFVLGCDGSILLDSIDGIESEKGAVQNIYSIRGFDVVDKIKELLEKKCPETVSCADILAIAARDAVQLRGGPQWKVELGRRDSLKASLNDANLNIPSPNSTLEVLISNFEAQGLSFVDLVTLSGSHTIGKSRCLSFKDRIYHEDETDVPIHSEVDHNHKRSSMFRRILRSICPRSDKRDEALVPLDFMTSAKFDNTYYINLLQDKGLLESDNVLISQDPGGEIVKLVWTYASDQRRFFKEYKLSIVKMGRINPLVGDEGEIRRNCSLVNSW